MAQLIVMPKLSDTMEEGAVASWLKKEGEAIDEGQDLVEIETDKATMAFASSAEGVVLKILLEPHKSAPLNAPMCVIGKKGESYSLDDLIAKASAGAKPAEKKSAPAVKAPVVALKTPSAVAAPAPVAAIITTTMRTRVFPCVVLDCTCKT